MDILPYEMLQITLYTIASGFALGLLLDLLSFVEIYVKKLLKSRYIPWTIAFTKDLCSVILFTLVLILVTYYINDGRFRSYLLLGIIIGAVSYRYTLGKIVKYLLNVIAEITLKILCFLFQPIAKLCVMLYNKLVRKELFYIK